MVDDRGPQLQAVCSTFLATAVISTLLRIYTRLGLVKSFGLDDWFMTGAMLAHIMFAACCLSGIHYGTGRQFTDLTEDGIMQALRYWWLCYLSYCLTMIGAKLAVGVMFLRLTINKIHIWIINTVMALTVLTGIVFLFVTVFQCNPVSFFWYRSQPGSCISIDVIIGLTYLYGTISAICDFTFGILPIFLVWNLQMDRRSKILLVPIIGMACIASAAVLVRMAYIEDFRKDDFLYNTVDIAIWSDVEQGLAITAGSLATLRPLFRLVSSKLGLSTIVGSNVPTPGAGGANKGLSYGRKSGMRSPFSLITVDAEEYHRMGDIRSPSTQGAPSISDPDKNGSTWLSGEADDSSEQELNMRRGTGDVESGVGVEKRKW